MARPRKQGVDYFPLDITLDDKFHLIEAQHGIIGFGVLIKMYQRIYSEGYCYTWTEREQLLFSSLISVDISKVIDIINDAIKWDIFDLGIYNKYNVLTSKGIQSRYVAITYKRASVEMEKRYLLIDVSDKSNISLTDVSDIQNKDTSIDMDSSGTQSKVKYSKVKDIVPISSERDWRKSFEVYQEYVREGYQEVINDFEWMDKQQEYNPSVDITKSIEKSCINFWSTEEGWANKKKNKAKTINWKTTFGNAISNKINKVYKDNKTYEDTRANQFGI